MAQLHPGGSSTEGDLHTLAYATLKDQTEDQPQGEKEIGALRLAGVH